MINETRAIVSQLAKQELCDTCAHLQSAVESEPQLTPDKHLSHILSYISLLDTSGDNNQYLLSIALRATQWAILCDRGRDVYNDVTCATLCRLFLPPSTPIDMAVNAGGAAHYLSRNRSPYWSLVELAGRSLAWASIESKYQVAGSRH